MNKIAILASMLFGACGSSERPYVVEVSFDSELFVNYREDAGQWAAPSMIGPHKYELWLSSSDSPVVFLAVCANDDGTFDAEEVAGTGPTISSVAITPSGPPISGGCSGEPSSSTDSFAVTGEMLQPGDVTLWETESSSVAPWDFTLTVPSGTYDLLAIGQVGSDLYGVLRRGQSIVQPTTLPAIDSSTSGEKLIKLPLAVTGELGNVGVSTILSLNSGTVVELSPGGVAGVAVLPPGLLESGDAQIVNVESSAVDQLGRNVLQTSQSAYTDETAIAIALMPQASPTYMGTADQPVASWDSTPFNKVDLKVTSSGKSIEHIAAFADWFAQPVGQSLSFLSDAPGFAARWQLDTSSQPVISFSIQADNQGVQAITTTVLAGSGS